MKALHDRYGHDRAAVMALSAGADMLMAIGSEEEQDAAIEAIGTALSRGELEATALVEARARLDRLAARFPARPGEYAADARLADAALMRRAWAAGLTVLDEAKPPPLDRPLRVVTQRRVPGDGISESGLSGDRVAALFAQFAAAEVVQVEDLLHPDGWSDTGDGRPTILASNIRTRYGSAVRHRLPDLHVILWNPFQALDLPVPSVITWGYGEGALVALRAWLEGRASAPGRSPVPLR
jgi:beta-N-acetylhexosaminidase